MYFSFRYISVSFVCVCVEKEMFIVIGKNAPVIDYPKSLDKKIIIIISSQDNYPKDAGTIRFLMLQPP